MRRIKLPQQAHLMGEPSLVPPDFFPPKKRQYEPSDWEIEAMEEEELLKQWQWYTSK
jgi:hypothetical protein